MKDERFYFIEDGWEAKFFAFKFQNEKRVFPPKSAFVLPSPPHLSGPVIAR
jgi:hypothetical protein